MHPGDLKANQFNSYPPEAKQLAVNNLGLFRRLPEAMLLIVLQELIEYDWKFPAERKELESQLTYLNSLSPDVFVSLMSGFAKLRLSPSLEKDDWVKAPRESVERLTADLWATHQIEEFRAAADRYQSSVNAFVQPDKPVVPRLAIVLIGQGVHEYDQPLFEKLRPNGVYFKNVRPEQGLDQLIDRLTKRALGYPGTYAHWYVDGGNAIQISASNNVTMVSYDALERPREILLGKMHQTISSGEGGPEGLRTSLGQMKPEELGMSDLSSDAVLNRFQLALLTEGSGTQIFSTAFVQWAAREILRRAQPLTLLVRFAPRQRQQSINELLSSKHSNSETDPAGSIVDADIGAYYTWLNLMRLADAERSSFVVWFEGSSQALGIGPSLPSGTESSTRTDLKGILDLTL